jgi:hypothetical protein
VLMRGGWGWVGGMAAKFDVLLGSGEEGAQHQRHRPVVSVPVTPLDARQQRRVSGGGHMDRPAAGRVEVPTS